MCVLKVSCYGWNKDTYVCFGQLTMTTEAMWQMKSHEASTACEFIVDRCILTRGNDKCVCLCFWFGTLTALGCKSLLRAWSSSEVLSEAKEVLCLKLQLLQTLGEFWMGSRRSICKPSAKMSGHVRHVLVWAAPWPQKHPIFLAISFVDNTDNH